MPRRHPRRHNTPAEPEKPFEALAEQAKQARTQFFVYLATVTFLLVTVLSITDKQLLLNNSLVTLPLINVSVEPKAVLILGPVLLLITFCNLHIHWFRYVKEVEAQGLNAPEKEHQLFPFMIYQALYHPHKGLVGFLESTLAKLALFGLLVPVQWCFVWQILKFHEILFSMGAVLMLGISIILNLYWYWVKKSFIGIQRNLNIGLLNKMKNIALSLYAILLLCVIFDFGWLLPHFSITATLLSPPPELLNTPLIKSFLERRYKGTTNQQHNKDSTNTLIPEDHDVFDDVYWLDLRESNLAWANLKGSTLLKTNFEGVNLSHSVLNEADLRHDNLNHVNLSYADLSGVNLSYANLSHADLQEVKLNDANLRKTNLTMIYFYTEKDVLSETLVPIYEVGGETLCQAKTLEYAQMDDWLFKKLKTIKGCNGKLEGVNTLPPAEES